jgi:hypothetical protein
MLVSGIQARPRLDPRLKHSGVTTLKIHITVFLVHRQRSVERFTPFIAVGKFSHEEVNISFACRIDFKSPLP